MSLNRVRVIPVRGCVCGVMRLFFVRLTFDGTVIKVQVSRMGVNAQP